MQKEAYLSPFLGCQCLSVVVKPAKGGCPTEVPFMNTVFLSWQHCTCQPVTPGEACNPCGV